MQHTDAEELARARLAYVSAGRPALSAPRRALPDVEDETRLLSQPRAGDEAPGPGDRFLSQPRARDEHRGWSKDPQADPPTSPLAAPQSPDPQPSRERPRLTLKHLVVVAVLLLCGVGVAVAALGRSAATEVPLKPVTVSAAPPPPSPPPPVVMLRVHVAGAVVEPGVVSLPEGTIVQDAILAAGGLAPDADPAALNLAAQVTDGMQIVIGTVGEPKGEVVGAEPPAAGTAGGSGAGGLVNLNTATTAELEALPGIGPVTAGAIIAWREESGPFSAVEDLQEISGIGPKTFQKLQPLVTVG
ncbi:helix-hairpin-helix domain-containing protein [Tessaracoccus lubricantis]|uniref:helix-hairpin-helix domain-containing protein n=1 Tax=Tessaracoccus lubricantis TaxID=545543 RepID=UPI00363BD8A3